MKKKRIGKHVMQCIKNCRGRFGFGCYHKKGQYITYSGKGSFDLNNAFIYSDLPKDIEEGGTNECPLMDGEQDEMFGYYKIVPIEVIRRIK